MKSRSEEGREKVRESSTTGGLRYWQIVMSSDHQRNNDVSGEIG